MTAVAVLRGRIVSTIHAAGRCQDRNGEIPECVELADRLLTGPLRPLLDARPCPACDREAR